MPRGNDRGTHFQARSGFGSRAPAPVAKTGNYTVTAAESGTVFTTRGAAGAVTFTLPAVTDNAGVHFWFFNVADQNMIVAGANGASVTFNDAAANSVAFQTAGEKIGGAFYAICDGTSWLILPHITEAQTITVAT